MERGARWRAWPLSVACSNHDDYTWERLLASLTVAHVGARVYRLIPPGTALVCLLAAAMAAPAAVPGQDGWKYDIVHLKNKKTVQGLVVEQGGRDILFKRVWRRPG